MAAKQIEQRVLIVTDGERIEGTLLHTDGMRLSDFLAAAEHYEISILKIKDPTVYCRRTGEELGRSRFLAVTRDRVVFVMVLETEMAAGGRDLGRKVPSLS